jgi:hypothetical protein
LELLVQTNERRRQVPALSTVLHLGRIVRESPDGQSRRLQVGGRVGSLELIDPMEGEVHDGRLDDGSPPEVAALVRWGSGLWLRHCGRLRSEGGKEGRWAAGLLVGSGILLRGVWLQELAWNWPAIGRPASKPRNRGGISAGIGLRACMTCMRLAAVTHRRGQE